MCIEDIQLMGWNPSTPLPAVQGHLGGDPSPWDSGVKSKFLWVLNLFPPSSLIYFVIDFGSLMRRLASGRAGDKMTGSQGLSALCSGFYLPDFMRLEPWLPLSWRNVKMILNHRVQAGDRRLLVTHLPSVPLVLGPWLCARGGGGVWRESVSFYLCSFTIAVLELQAVLSGWSWQLSCALRGCSQGQPRCACQDSAKGKAWQDGSTTGTARLAGLFRFSDDFCSAWDAIRGLTSSRQLLYH